MPRFRAPVLWNPAPAAAPVARGNSARPSGPPGAWRRGRAVSREAPRAEPGPGPPVRAPRTEPGPGPPVRGRSSCRDAAGGLRTFVPGGHSGPSRPRAAADCSGAAGLALPPARGRRAASAAGTPRAGGRPRCAGRGARCGQWPRRSGSRPALGRWPSRPARLPAPREGPPPTQGGGPEARAGDGAPQGRAGARSPGRRNPPPGRRGAWPRSAGRAGISCIPRCPAGWWPRRCPWRPGPRRRPPTPGRAGRRGWG